MEISIKTNFPEVQRALDRLQADVGGKAMASALNKTMAQSRTAMSRAIRSEFNISAAKVREKLQVVNARFVGGRLHLVAELKSYNKFDETRALNLINFDARETAKGVTVKIKRKGGRKLLKGAFLGNKSRTVFTRVPGSTMVSRARSSGETHREKIRPLQTIDVPSMFNTRRINSKVVADMLIKFPVIFDREAAYYVRKFSGK